MAGGASSPPRLAHSGFDRRAGMVGRAARSGGQDVGAATCTGALGLNDAAIVRMKIGDAPGDEGRHRCAAEGIAVKGRVATL